jgi:hypothetical protein
MQNPKSNRFITWHLVKGCPNFLALTIRRWEKIGPTLKESKLANPEQKCKVPGVQIRRTVCRTGHRTTRHVQICRTFALYGIEILKIQFVFISLYVDGNR